MTLHAIFPVADRSADQRAADAARHLGAQLIATLSTARILVESGREVDLSGAQDSVGQLCARILDLPPANGRELLDVLQAVQAEVDRTTAALELRTSA
ncbi:MAG: hypothetical protein ACRYG6_11360 [Janthinobacterium lividum]